jgi:hypothetical protein
VLENDTRADVVPKEYGEEGGHEILPQEVHGSVELGEAEEEDVGTVDDLRISTLQAWKGRSAKQKTS